ncbi:MAG: DUF4143 domain-containing protein [Oceanipulchritudo sp.]
MGKLFENLVVLVCLKARYNQGKEAGLYFFSDSNGNEIDLLQARTIVYNGEPLDFNDGISAVRFDRITERLVG